VSMFSYYPRKNAPFLRRSRVARTIKLNRVFIRTPYQIRFKCQMGSLGKRNAGDKPASYKRRREGEVSRDPVDEERPPLTTIACCEAPFQGLCFMPYTEDRISSPWEGNACVRLLT